MIAAMVPLPFPPLPDAIAWLALPPLALAAMSDIAVRRIPNGLALGVALAGLGRQAGAGAAVTVVAMLAAAAVGLVAGVLWLRGAMGGGDVKLLAAATLLVPPGEVIALLLAVAIAGGLLSLVHLLLRPALRGRVRGAAPGRPWRRVLRVEAWRIGRAASLPYGVAIAAGAAFLLIRPMG